MRLALFFALGLGCGVSALPLEFGSEWPSEPPSLEVATKTWTRGASDRAGLSEDVELVIQVRATFRSPQWRAAYVEHLRKSGDLSKSDTEALIEKQKKAAAEHHEFVLLVSTHDRRINDLAKGDRSSWRVRLRNGQGGEASPVKIFKDRRPAPEIAAELPHLTSFDEIYIAQFPGDFALLGSGAEKFSLHISSARGSVAINWVK